VSDYGTGTVMLCLETFLGSALICISPANRKFHLNLGMPLKAGSGICLGTALIKTTHIQLCAQTTAPRHPIAHHCSHGILTVLPSAAALAIALGPTNPWLIVIAKETLVFRRGGFQPPLWLLVPTFLLRNAPESVALLLHCRCEYSPTALHQ